MSCDELQPLLRDRERLAGEQRRAVDEHLSGCAACRKVAEDETALDRLLDQLPQYPASAALKRRLRERLPAERPPRRWIMPAFAAVAACAILAVIVVPSRHNPLVDEAVADHLRNVYRVQQVDIASGGPHQVKPWFTGKLDFALPSLFGGNDEFTLEGGAVTYYLDRQAALIVYKRALHTVSLLVFRSDGLAFPRAQRDLGPVVAHTQRERGFSVVVWRDGELGYALCSDVALDDLQRLAALIAAR
jgi:anti-sigma factor RsiW